MKRELLLGALAWAIGSWGCMHTDSRVVTSRSRARSTIGPAIPELRRTYAQWQPGNAGVALVVVGQDSCFATSGVVVQRSEVTESHASSARWVGVVVAGALSAGQIGVALGEDDTTARAKDYGGAAAWAAVAVAAAVVPVMLESRTVRQLPDDSRANPPAVVACGPTQPVVGVRVTIRANASEHTAITDAQGRAVFEGVTESDVDQVFVDDVLVHPTYSDSVEHRPPSR